MISFYPQAKYDKDATVVFLTAGQTHARFKNELEKASKEYIIITLLTGKVDWDTDETHISILPKDEWLSFFSDDFEVVKEDIFAEHRALIVLKRRSEQC